MTCDVMNARQLIENEEEDIKGEMLDVPCYVTTKHHDLLYYLKRETKREGQARRGRADEGFNIGHEYFIWTWSRYAATAFNRNEAFALIQKIQKNWKPATAYDFEIMPAS